MREICFIFLKIYEEIEVINKNCDYVSPKSGSLIVQNTSFGSQIHDHF